MAGLRDFLRGHPGQAAGYGELKHHLARLLATDRLAYGEGEAEMIAEFLRQARTRPGRSLPTGDSIRMEAVSDPGGGVPNEDWFGCTADAVVVLDGVTVLPGIESGCVHGTPWYVRLLGTELLSAMTRHPSQPLTAALGTAIAEVTELHADTCDLNAIGSPSATVAAVRVTGGELEYLVLADVTVVLETATLAVITDDRVAASVAGLSAKSPHLGEQLGKARRAHRNRPGGYWVAADNPAAAEHAVTGSVPIGEVQRVMILSDGAARLVDMFGRDWAYALAAGPAGVIREVRALEGNDPDCTRWPRVKFRDDATAVLWAFSGGG